MNQHFLYATTEVITLAINTFMQTLKYYILGICTYIHKYIFIYPHIHLYTKTIRFFYIHSHTLIFYSIFFNSSIYIMCVGGVPYLGLGLGKIVYSNPTQSSMSG